MASRDLAGDKKCEPAPAAINSEMASVLNAANERVRKKSRSDKHTRAVATRKTRDNIELLTSLIRETNKSDKDTTRSRAVMTYCAMVGAISMARAVSDKELSREILKTVTRRLKNSAS